MALPLAWLLPSRYARLQPHNKRMVANTTTCLHVGPFEAGSILLSLFGLCAASAHVLHYRPSGRIESSAAANGGAWRMCTCQAITYAAGLDQPPPSSRLSLPQASSALSVGPRGHLQTRAS